MSGRILSHRLIPLLRTGRLARHVHNAGARTGGLLRSEGGAALRRRAWPAGAYAIHNVPAVRTISFARMLPKLAMKLVRVPAMFGGAMIAGFAYIQYQAAQAGNYAIDIFKRTGETVGGAASSFFQELQNVADQTQRGWQKSTEDIEVPEWLQKIFRLNEDPQGGNDGSSGGGESPKQSRSGVAAAGAATGAAFGYNQSDEEDFRRAREIAEDDQMMLLTRKMIEIRNILQTVGQSGTLTLPSIVVIGSQSSGKSSVLEAIVGHEFLPKGSNMVTRRPIELTLVNTPNSQSEYGEFPALGLGKITDFSQIQRTLTDLNLAVPERDCVSDDPIQLTIHSPNVPDLSLIDLPGYIQVAGKDQPLELKQKISDLCDKYIQPPNVILAISAADVDLANSTALRASRRVDPRGERTIGVITKMDLVDPERGQSILSDQKYPLRLGYVGVVSRIPQTTALFSRGSGNITSAILKNENAYFSAHPSEFGPQSGVSVGVTTLRSKLMHVLEQTMASGLAGTRDAISQELEEATYEFKVQYNDRPLSAESYLAESLDSFKHSFKAFAENFGRPQVREMLKNELDQRVMDILAQRYWNKPIEYLAASMPELDPLSDLPKADPDSQYWRRKLDASTSSLTKLGIGRLATTVVASAIQNHVDRLLANSTFANHPYAQRQIVEACTSILNDRFFSTSDQVENCIKPYKFEIEVEDPEWAKGRENISRVLKEELKACESAYRHVEDAVGKRKFKDVMSFVDRVRKGEAVLEGDGGGGAGGFSSALLDKGREGVFLRDRADLIKMRLLAIRSKQCASKKNKYYCPEVFLDVVADKLTSTAVLFLNVELLSEFYYNFPRELDMRLGRHLSDAEVERFAREDPRIRKHLDVIRKKELLELALQKIESIRQLDGRTKQRNGDRPLVNKEQRSRGWNIF
ncbi:dynamin-related GTPase MGM1 [Aspergillus clavatus NRRL 1]|uniref:dynamin GTPase n=1 Tax=Aspergillus clavatus (strain ATCC 1007 / CBS 513.65 / DSM 816 / NCTC 3887 / NRRL 1 / QM 1276 / 107) TaxID=344612 RepID=A1CPS6_ASPCL|nr:mitochondrial dynamin GTPase (Msp1), putative [Aspergillus clavatus NRRL 1]EAW07647.1 mitochondrial dynamin GTPase (Msp1), putative [Aspergillus clavatus NRRL 1]